MDDATFAFLRQILADSLELLASRIRLCVDVAELMGLLGNQSAMCSVWLDRIADSLIAAGVVVRVKDAFKDGLSKIAEELAALSPKALQRAYAGRGCAGVLENVIGGIGLSLFETMDCLVKTLHEAIMGLLKAGVIITFKGAAGVLQRSYLHWFTLVGAVAGGVCVAPAFGFFAVPATAVGATVAAGAVAGTAAVGIVRWAYGS